MPRNKGKSITEDVEASTDVPDNDTLEWSDEEDSVSNSGQENGHTVDVLKQLIQHGFDVKGKLIDGKLSYVFRTPETPVKPRVKGEGHHDVVRAHTLPTYVGGGAVHYGPGVDFSSPPAYECSSPNPNTDREKISKKKRTNSQGWIRR